MAASDGPDIPLDLAPESRLIITGLAELGLVDEEVSSVADIRRVAAAERPLMGDPPAVAGVEEVGVETSAGLLRLRIYFPDAEPERAILWIHGGGWVLGDLEHGDVDCRGLCSDTDSLVIAVDYRLAPEHPFPAGLEDVYAALEWTATELAGQGRALPMVVAGDSAGGNLAAAACLLARDRGGPTIDQQLLFYPVTDNDFENASYREFGERYVLTRELMVKFWDWYVGEAAGEAPELAAVLRAGDLHGLPPATFVIAGCDVLRDEGKAYAARLRVADLPVTVLHYRGQLHGFWSYPAAAGMSSAVNADVRRALAANERA